MSGTIVVAWYACRQCVVHVSKEYTGISKRNANQSIRVKSMEYSWSQECDAIKR